MNRDGQTFKISTTTYLVIQELTGPWDTLPHDAEGHLIVSLTTNKQLKVSEAYLANLEERGARLT